MLHRMQIFHSYSKQHGQDMPFSLVSYIYIYKGKIEYEKTNLLFSLLITFESVSETWYKDHASVVYPGHIYADNDKQHSGQYPLILFS